MSLSERREERGESLRLKEERGEREREVRKRQRGGELKEGRRERETDQKRPMSRQAVAGQGPQGNGTAALWPCAVLPSISGQGVVVNQVQMQRGNVGSSASAWEPAAVKVEMKRVGRSHLLSVYRQRGSVGGTYDSL